MGKIEVNSERWMNPKNLNGEKWRFVYETSRGRKYLVSNMGRMKLIKKCGNEIIMKAYKNRPDGYYKVSIDGFQEYVHRIVATAFVRRAYYWYTVIDHRNGEKDDNRARNLRWATPKINQNNPITTWARRKRNGLDCQEEKPKPSIAQNILPEKGGLAAIEKSVKTKAHSLYMNRLFEKFNL